jgi:lysophospholipase L1-like esterase
MGVLLALVLGSTSVARGVPPTSVSVPVEHYAALGDSYVAGAFTGLPTRHVPGCLQTHGNYPHRAAAVLGAILTDVSCSSATTDDVFAPQVTDGYLGGTAPAQLDAVTADTTMVSIGLGGNDIGSGEIFQRCPSLLPVGSPCRDRFVSNGVDELAVRVDAVGPKLDAVLAAVSARAPTADVYVVGYPSVFPDNGKPCWPVAPITGTDIRYLRDTFKRLNAVLESSAEAAGATYVDTYTPSIGHDFCHLPSVKWIEPLLPTAPASPFHPNARGELGMADALLAAVAAQAS